MEGGQDRNKKEYKSRGGKKSKVKFWKYIFNRNGCLKGKESEENLASSTFMIAVIITIIIVKTGPNLT